MNIFAILNLQILSLFKTFHLFIPLKSNFQNENIN